MLSILAWLFMGLFIGAIGQAFMPGKDPGRIDGTVLMGLCGALIGGLISGSPFRAGQGDAGFLVSLAFAVLGSLVVLAVHRWLIGVSFGVWLTKLGPLFKTRGLLLERFQTLKRSAVYLKQKFDEGARS
jgi:uncharacterized membrane protein YeaQ/YmgE (transglycosylase-associated protein family)